MLDVLSQHPAPTDSKAELEVQVAQISVKSDPDTIETLLCRDHTFNNITKNNSFADEQLKDPVLQPIILHLSQGVLLNEAQFATKIVTQASMYTLVDDILYYSGQKSDLPRAVVPCGLQQNMVEEYHGGVMAGP